MCMRFGRSCNPGFRRDKFCQVLKSFDKFCQAGDWGHIGDVLAIGNTSEWLHFKDGTLNFQNLQKNQNFVENSSQKLILKIFKIFQKSTIFRNFEISIFLDFFSKIFRNFSKHLKFQNYFLRRIFNGFHIFLKILKI